MSLWCQDFPTVTVPQGVEPKPFTLVLPYFENPNFLAKQIWEWGQFPGSVREHMRVIVADDGSPKHPAAGVFKEHFCNVRHRLFRVEVDVRCNWLAARNIGAHHAENGWLLLTDMDHVLPVETARSLIYGQHDPKVVYAFSRTGKKEHPHSASFFMTREMFWRIGGYDETFSGLYSNDGPYRRQLAPHAKIRILTDILVCHEYEGDSSTPKDEISKPGDGAARARINASLPPNHKPKVLSFPYHEVVL